MRMTRMSAIAIALAATIASGGTLAQAQLPPNPNSIIGTWFVNTPLQIAGTRMSFREDGSMRMIMEADPADVKNMPNMPPDKKASMQKSLFYVDKKPYMNIPGRWSMSTNKLKVNFVDPAQPTHVIETDEYVVRFMPPTSVSLMQEGVTPQIMTYVNVPLPVGP